MKITTEKGGRLITNSSGSKKDQTKATKTLRLCAPVVGGKIRCLSMLST